MACRLVGAKPLSKLMLDYCSFGASEQTSVKSCRELQIFSFKKMHLKMRLQNGAHFVAASMSKGGLDIVKQ